MGIILDIIIIVLFILSIWLGYKKGLTKSLLKILTFILAIIISLILYRPVANFIINETKIVDNLQNAISGAFKENDAKKDESNFDIEDNDNNQTEYNEKNMPRVFYNYIEEKIVESTAEAKDIIIETASREVAISIVNISVFIILFIVIRIILIFVKAITNIITKLPVIKQCDELGGGIYGALRGCIVILILFTIISVISPLIPESGIIEIINESMLARYIYENNIIIRIIL